MKYEDAIAKYDPVIGIEKHQEGPLGLPRTPVPGRAHTPVLLSQDSHRISPRHSKAAWASPNRNSQPIRR